MNKNYRVIKINGFRGVLTALFVICCMTTGFLAFPGWVFMHLWNYVATFFILMPEVHLVHGIMLWAIVALSIYALNNNRMLIGFSSPPALNEEQIKDLVARVKHSASTTNPIMSENQEKEKNTSESLDEIRK